MPWWQAPAPVRWLLAVRCCWHHLVASGALPCFQLALKPSHLRPSRLDPAGKGSLDNINLFSIITIVSFIFLAPVALLSEVGAPGWLQHLCPHMPALRLCAQHS